jgi:hypothetical protein
VCVYEIFQSKQGTFEVVEMADGENVERICVVTDYQKGRW